MREYQEDKDSKKFLERLLAIDKKPRSMTAEIIWYINISTALSESGRQEESIALLNQLEEVATETEKELIQKNRKFIQEQLEKVQENAINV